MQYNIKKIFTFLVLLIFLEILSGNAYAATLAWTNAGGDNLASTPANWSGNKAPQNGDIVEFDSTSTDNCTWDLPLVSASFSINSGYTGTIILDSDLEVAKVNTWTGSGGNAFASNDANWSTNHAPQGSGFLS